MAALMKLRVDLRVHPRLDRSGRGRPDASAGRACGSLRLIPNLDVWRPCDRRRDRRRLGRSGRATRRPDAPAAVAPEAAGAAARRRARGAGIARGGYVLAEAPSGAAAVRADRHRLGSGARARRAGSCSPRRGIAARVVSMPSTSVFDRQDAELRRSGAAARRAARRGRGRHAAISGANMWVSRAPWSASTASANRRRPRRSSRHFGFTPERLAEVAARCARRALYDRRFERAGR